MNCTKFRKVVVYPELAPAYTKGFVIDLDFRTVPYDCRPTQKLMSVIVGAKCRIHYYLKSVRVRWRSKCGKTGGKKGWSGHRMEIDNR